MLVKGIDGILEMLGSILLLFLSPDRMHAIVRVLTQHELSEDPRDVIANLLINLSKGFSVSAQYFGALYLAAHGIVKCVFAYLLWRKKLWAYPLAAGALVLFIAYQIYRYIVSPSAALVVLSAFDAVMFILTVKEYRRMKASASL